MRSRFSCKPARAKAIPFQQVKRRMEESDADSVSVFRGRRLRFDAAADTDSDINMFKNSRSLWKNLSWSSSRKRSWK